MEFKFRHLLAILRRFNVSKIDAFHPAGWGLEGPHFISREIICIPIQAYPIDHDVPISIVNSVRRHFGLVPENGITNDIFYGTGVEKPSE